MITESKIEATERLRAEGRWEVASVFRDRERERLRDEGKTRKEAREESWCSMLERFGPPDEDVFFTFRASAEFPPTPEINVSEEQEQEFVDLWRTYCLFSASVCYRNPGLVDHDRLYALITRRLKLPQYASLEGSTERQKSLLRMAFETCPQLFLDLVGSTFRLMLEQITTDDELSDAIRSELNFYLERLPALKESAESFSLRDLPRCG